MVLNDKTAMGAECVRMSPKITAQSHNKRTSESSKLRASDEMLHFEIIISDLELQCTAQNVGKVVFSIENYFHLQFSCDQFFHIDTMIRCTNQKKAGFSVYYKNIQFLEFNVSILDTKGSKIEKVCLKMHAVCEGPRHHDHLLKQMKARIMYNLEISQLINASLGCSDFRIYDSMRCDVTNDYRLTLNMIIPGKDILQNDQNRILFSRNPQQCQKYLQNNVPSKKLRQSLFRIIIFNNSKSSSLDSSSQTHQLCIPYMKFWQQDDMSIVSQKNGDKIFQKINLKFSERIKESNGTFIDVYLELNLKTSKIYLEQIQCLILSQNGLKTVSPSLLKNKNSFNEDNLKLSHLQPYENIFRKQKRVTYQTKNYLQKNIKECYSTLFETGKLKICDLSQLESVQMTMLMILNSLCQLITEGQDLTNQSIWLLIDKIIHRPELSINYLYLIQSSAQKTQIGLKFYGFLFGMLRKIIMCTTVGLTYHQLKCIQKFIGYVYFRCRWVQDLVAKSLQDKDDPEFTPEKLMDIGVYHSNKSPSKSLVYEWEQCLLPFIKEDPRYRQISNQLLDTSESIPKWGENLFNREDDDLYYGLMIQILNEAEIFLNNQGRIMWEYFPNYGLLLSTFLGEMNRNKIMDYSSLFRECSMKLISNQKLLNSFVMFLFPKTCLYETFCVIKCLELIHSYFEVISNKKKKLPNQFNFNYFYTGISQIFESNHSYLLIRVIGLLYDYYHIFLNDFKISLNRLIFGKAFNQIFLHWCGFVRKMFYLFLEHKVIAELKQCEKNQNSKSLIGFDGIERLYQYKVLIQNLENSEKKMEQSRRFIGKGKDALYLRMIQKLKNRKTEKKKLYYNQQKAVTSSVDLLNCEPSLSRKNTQSSMSSNNLLGKQSRRWSLYNEKQLDYFQVNQNLNKYIIVALKQYHEMKKVEKPDEQVKKIMKMFNNEKSVDN